MPLDIAENDAPPSDSDPFGEPDAYGDPGTSTYYPPPLPLAPLSRLLGYSEANRAFFVRRTIEHTSELLDLQLTPQEREGLSYYSSRFYAYESFGDVLGVTAGLFIAFMLRNRKPGHVSNFLARPFTPERRANAAWWVSRGMKFAAWGVAGRMYGLTTAGFQALNRNKMDKKGDENLKRVIAAAEKKRNVLLASEIASEVSKGAAGGVYGDEEGQDEQSLGGLDIGSDQKEGPTATSSRGEPPERVTGIEDRKSAGAQDDPFLLDDASSSTAQASGGQAPRKGWSNANSTTTSGESAWERIRKAQLPSSRSPPQPQDSDDTPPETKTSSPWPTRAPMKGYGTASAGLPGAPPPKTDSFPFSPTERERHLAKLEAQREFDARVDRERAGKAGDGYAEGDATKRWSS